MNDLGTTEKPSSLWRRLLWVSGAPALALCIVSVAVFSYRESHAAGELAEVLRRLDETDPGWRLEEIEAARVDPPEADNSAALCRELVHLLGPSWPDARFAERFDSVPLRGSLDAQRKIILEDEMDRLRSVRDIARKMVSLPRGRHKIEYEHEPFSTLRNDQQDVRKVAQLFDYEMLYRANRGEVSEAVRAGRGCLCAARSLYDEPSMISALVRLGVVAVGLRGVERSLALGESNDAELAALDALLAEEGRQNVYLLGARGERAMVYLLYKRIAAGELPPDLVVPKEEGVGRLFSSPRRSVGRRVPAVMRAMNRAVDIARLPPQEQAAAEKALGDELENDREDASLLFASLEKFGAACRREASRRAAMRGLIAVERYRMKHHEWPAKLADAVPEFLKEVPADPFDGKPLRMVRVADGMIVYSVGPNGKDDGGKLDRENQAAPGADLGFRLGDVAKRRRPAPAVAPQEKDP